MNTYLEEFEKLQSENTFRGQQWFGKRRELVEEYSWAVPSEEVLLYLSEFESLTEVGAGNGYWASLLAEQGVDVTAFDKTVPEDTYYPVEERDIFDAMKAGIAKEPVLMVWPPCHKEVAAATVKKKPSHVLYIGERRGGCTATSAFFDLIEDQYGLVAKIDLPSYAGINDNFYHYTLKR